MSDVFVVRRFDPPLTDESFEALARDGADCLDLYRVQWRQSLLSADGRRLLCWFSAPDAESTRLALRKAGSRDAAPWPGSIHDAPPGAPPADAANVVVERSFEAPVTLEEIQAIEDAGASCLAARNVEFVRTFFSRDRKRMICLYRAPDAESVREAQRQAGMPVDAVWSCRLKRRLRSSPRKFHARSHARFHVRGRTWDRPARGAGSSEPDTARQPRSRRRLPMSTATPIIDNGVDAAALVGAREALTEAPEGARFQWRATCDWVHGTHAASTVEGFHGLGEEQRHRTRFSFDSDHPEVFASRDQGPTPVEYVLVGLAGCLTAGVASIAQHRGIQLHSVRATVEGDMDIQGILGIDGDVRNGFERIQVAFEIDADASREEIEALVAQSQKRSAVFDIVANPGDVSVVVK